jgi:hypothetical protein
MADQLEVPKSQAIALLVALGMKGAKKWDCDKLTDKLNAIEELPEEPFEDTMDVDGEDLDELGEHLMDADEAVVIDPDAEPEEDEPEDDEDDVEDDVDDDEEEDEPEPKKSKKKDKKAAKKKEKKKAAKKETGPSIDQVTLDLLKAKPMKLETLHKAVCKKFPEKDEEALLRTTKRRVSGHLANKFGVEIVKSEKGVYSVEE